MRGKTDAIHSFFSNEHHGAYIDRDPDEEALHEAWHAISAARGALAAAMAANNHDKNTAAGAATSAWPIKKTHDEALDYVKGSTRFSSSEFETHSHSPCDYKLLAELAVDENWADRTPISPELFSPDSRIERQVILAVNDLCVELCKIIAKNPSALDLVEWRQLEQIIATALSGIGFSVELTPGSKDGGKDIVATCQVKGATKTFYIEIKHWRSGKSVGEQAVNNFVEVTAGDGVDGGLLLSSSGYSRKIMSSIGEIYSSRVRLGGQVKILSLCQRFVQRGLRAAWEAEDVLPQALFADTIMANHP